tara:strand:- start:902 stop:1519 length:618 start_codon:yes stop_codon:yes gene_type:complete
MTTATKWSLSGTYFESCNCKVACPCIFLSPPTSDEGDCKALLAWNIENGEYDGVSLGGLKVALAVNCPGVMADGNWRVALYVDENANQEQNSALQQIYSGQRGGIFELLAGFITEIIGVTSTSIEFDSEGKQRSIKIGDIAEGSIVAIEGFDGQDVIISGAPLDATPGSPMIVSKSTVNNYQDHGIEWDISGNSGYQSDFSYQNF